MTTADPMEDLEEVDDSFDYLPETQRILAEADPAATAAAGETTTADVFTYVDMILGRWMWNRDGEPSAFLELYENNTCGFVSTADESEIPMTSCEWTWDEAAEQLKFVVP